MRSGNRPGVASVILGTMLPKRLSVCGLVLAAVVLVVGCSNGGGKHAAQTTTKATASTAARKLVITTPFTFVQVSNACRAAVKSVAITGVAFHPYHGLPSGAAASAFARQDSLTLGACKSKDEWLTAVQAFIGPADHNAGAWRNVDPFTILQGFCDGNRLDTGIPGVPAKAPACTGVPDGRLRS
jgi:hypothetical protein